MGWQVAFMAVAAGAEVGSAAAQASAAKSRLRSLDTQERQSVLQTQQKQLAAFDSMERVIDAQVAHMTTTGAAFSSPSFNAIQRNTLNIGKRNLRNIELEGDIAKQSFELEKDSVKDSLHAQLFGDAFQLASMGISYSKNAPTKMPTLGE